MEKNENKTFIKVKGTVLINNKLMVPATFVILNGGVSTLFVFSNFFLNKEDSVVCCLPENIKMLGSVVDSSSVQSVAFKKVESTIYKSIIALKIESRPILVYTKEVFKKDHTFSI